MLLLAMRSISGVQHSRPWPAKRPLRVAHFDANQCVFPAETDWCTLHQSITANVFLKSISLISLGQSTVPGYGRTATLMQQRRPRKRSPVVNSRRRPAQQIAGHRIVFNIAKCHTLSISLFFMINQRAAEEARSDSQGVEFNEESTRNPQKNFRKVTRELLKRSRTESEV